MSNDVLNSQTKSINEELINNQINTKKIDDVTEKNIQASEEKLDDKKEKKQKKSSFTPEQKKFLIRNIICVVSIVFLFLVFIKVPYIGAFFDSVFLDFLFGWTKYIIYMFLLVFCLSIVSKKIKNLFISKKKICIYVLFILLFSIFLNAISFYSNSDIRQYYTNFDISKIYVGTDGYITRWYDNIFLVGTSNYNGDFGKMWCPQWFSYGGLIGLSIINLTMISTPIVIVIILLIIGVLGSLILFNTKKVNETFKKIKEKTIKKFGGFNSKEVNIVDEKTNIQQQELQQNSPSSNVNVEQYSDVTPCEVIEQNNDIVSVQQINNAATTTSTELVEINNNALKNDFDTSKANLEKDVDYSNFEYPKLLTKKLSTRVLNLDLVENTNVDNYLDLNYCKIDDFRIAINKFLSLFFPNNVKPEEVSFKILFQSISLEYYIIDDVLVNRILNSGDQINELLKQEKVIIYKKNNSVVFEIVLKHKNIISFQEMVKNNKFSYLDIPLGLDDKRNVVKINALDKSSILITGTIGSGRAMLVSNIITELLLRNTTKYIDVTIFDSTEKTFNRTFNNFINYIWTENELVKLLDNIYLEINEINNKLYSNNFINIYDYNSKNVDKPFKNKIIVINDLFKINEFEKSNEIWKKLIYLLKISKRFGYIFILTSSEINENIALFKKYVESIVCLKTSCIEQSEQLLNNNMGYYLIGNGDMYLQINDEEIRAQCSLLKKDEIIKLLENNEV